MNDTKVVVKIAVTRTVDDREEESLATVTAELEERGGLNPAWIADKLGTAALRHLDKRYDFVAKRLETFAPNHTKKSPP